VEDFLDQHSRFYAQKKVLKKNAYGSGSYTKGNTSAMSNQSPQDKAKEDEAAHH